MSRRSPAKRVKSPRSSRKVVTKRRATLGKYPSTPEEKVLYKDPEIKSIVDEFNKMRLTDLEDKFSNEGISNEFLRSKRDYINRYLGIMSLHPPESVVNITSAEEDILLNPEDATLRRSK